MNKKSTRLLLLSLLIVLIIFTIIKFKHYFTLSELSGYLTQLNSSYAALVFIFIYALATILFLPGSALTLAGGLVFGPVMGVIYSMAGAMLGASIAFLLARYLAADWVGQKAGGKLDNLIAGVDKQGWKFVAIVRLVPVLPFNLLNYALGLTRIGFWQYFIASIIFMLPGAIAYTYVGSLGQAFIQNGGQGMLNKIFLGVGFFVILACIPWLVKKYQQSREQ